MQVLAVVGARLNSSRLAGKHLLPLAGKPLIEHIVTRLQAVGRIDKIVLATTADDFNRPLVDWAQGYGLDVLAYGGDVDDLVGRVDTVVQDTKASHVLYVCGDSPLIEPSTIRRMIDAMAAAPEGDCAELKPLASGRKFIHEGFNLYSRRFWDAIVEASTNKFSREHVGSAFHYYGWVKPREIVLVDEPEIYAALDHRISVDTPTDYRFMRRIYADWYASHGADEIVDLRATIERLQRDEDLISLNRHVRQKKVGETSRSVLIVADVGKTVGLGHLSRATVVAAALQDFMAAKVELVLMGDPVEREELALVPHRWVDEAGLEACIGQSHPDAIVVDMKTPPSALLDWLRANASKAVRMAIDPAADAEDAFDHVWVPSFYLSPERGRRLEGRVQYGWDHYLLQTGRRKTRQAGTGVPRKLLVLTGGSDPAKLAHVWPAMLEQAVSADVNIDWVKGPFADAPTGFSRQNWMLLDAPTDLAERYADYDAALCVFGVSFFECLRAGLPVVACDPLGVADPGEWDQLRHEMPAAVAASPEEAAIKVAKLLSGGGAVPDTATTLGDGPQKFAAFLEQQLDS